mgnify:CR=1 FL=1
MLLLECLHSISLDDAVEEGGSAVFSQFIFVGFN